MRRLLFLLLFIPAIAFPQEAHWLFENNWTDEKGNHNGTAKDYASFTGSYLYQGSYSADFNVYSKNRMVTQNKIDLSTGGVTISFAVRQSNTGSIRTLLGNQPSTTTKGFRVDYDEPNQRIIVNTHNGSTSAEAYSANSALTVSTWCWVTVRWYDVNAQYVTVFVNGAQTGTDSTALAACGLNDTLSIGAMRNGNNTLYGRMDNVSVYLCALSDAKILDLYNNSTTNYEVSCSSTNASPTASALNITGDLNVGDVLTSHYTYADAESDAEGTSTYKWYRANSSAGSGEAAIGGATTYTHTIVNADTGKYLSFSITPVAATGTTPGLETQSDRVYIPEPNYVAPTSTTGGYDSTKVLAYTQKFAIPEGVANGDYVGYWKQCVAWHEVGAVSFSITTNFDNAFAINASTGLITINDATDISGKVVLQDTTIRLVITSEDAGIAGYSEIDTAVIYVKENAYCKFIDYTTSGTGTKVSPLIDFPYGSLAAGYGYFIKRGVSKTDKSYVIAEAYCPQSTSANPMIIGVYGTGNSPLFSGTGAANNCFFEFVANIDVPGDHFSYCYIFDLTIKNFQREGIKVWPYSSHIGFYNLTFEGNCIQYTYDVGDVYTYGYEADSVTLYYDEMINCVSTESWGPILKTDNSGWTVTNVSSKPHVFSGRIYYTFRFAVGQHMLLRGFEFECNSSWCYGLQVRFPECTIQDGTIKYGWIGIYVTDDYSGGFLGRPDYLKVSNVKIMNCEYGINYTVSTPGGGINSTLIERCKFDNNTYGIYNIAKGNDNIIKGNLFTNSSSSCIELNHSGIYNMHVEFNLMYGNAGYAVRLRNAGNLCVVRNNTSYDNDPGDDFYKTSASTVYLQNNIYDHADATWEKETNYSYDDGDPFTSASTNDFSLAAGSYPIDHGTYYEATTDYNGVTVPTGTATDIGCLEYTTYPTVPGTRKKMLNRVFIMHY